MKAVIILSFALVHSVAAAPLDAPILEIEGTLAKG